MVWLMLIYKFRIWTGLCILFIGLS